MMMKGYIIKIKRFIRDIIPISVILLLGFTSCAYYEKPYVDVPDEVSFSEDLIPYFETSCATSGCHDGSIPPNLSEELAYTSLTIGGYIDLDIPEQSLLYTKIDVGGSMEQYSTTRDTEMVLRWIEQGAENN